RHGGRWMRSSLRTRVHSSWWMNSLRTVGQSTGTNPKRMRCLWASSRYLPVCSHRQPSVSRRRRSGPVSLAVPTFPSGKYPPVDFPPAATAIRGRGKGHAGGIEQGGGRRVQLHALSRFVSVVLDPLDRRLRFSVGVPP